MGTKKTWTKQEVEIAVRVWNEMDGQLVSPRCRAIAEELGRTPQSVMSRYDRYGPTFALEGRVDTKGFATPQRSFEVPPEVLEERDRAYGAPVSLTAAFFGDPRPGRSALEARR